MRTFGGVCPKKQGSLDRTPQQRNIVVAAYLSDDFEAPMFNIHIERQVNRGWI
jgi:hypothetical protein